MESTINLTVNGQRRTATTDPKRPLLDVLREDLELTGTKYGCGGRRRSAGHAWCSWTTSGRSPAAPRSSTSRESRSLRSRGSAKGDEDSTVQRAFMEENAYQCGYCIPGMIMGTVALLKEKPKPSDEEIRNWLSHQICRCCGYPRILNAVRRAANA